MPYAHSIFRKLEYIEIFSILFDLFNFDCLSKISIFCKPAAEVNVKYALLLISPFTVA